MEQTDFADIAGVSRSTVSRVERGETEYRHAALRKIEAHFGAPVELLLGNDAPGPHWLADYLQLGGPQRELADRLIAALVKELQR